MPEVDLKIEDQREGVALWHVAESERELEQLVENERCPGEILHEQKRREWLAGRALILRLTRFAGIEFRGIVKDQFGKPFLKDSEYFITLSHSFPYVAAQISNKVPVGIDVEQPTEKLLRIAPRILDPVELENAGDDIVKHCIYWCAKEALYKIYGKRGLLFTNHLRVHPFVKQEMGNLSGVIEFNGVIQNAKLVYRIEKDFVMVFTKTLDQ